MNFTISERLKKIAGLVPDNAEVADIGTDHGYLPVFLAEIGKSQRIIACDINRLPLENARKSVKASNKANKIELRLCDGLKGISEEEIDTVIIAGMGAEVISGILTRCKWIKREKYTLILQPMTSPEILRKYLADNAFDIIQESAIEENSKLYSIIKARFCGTIREVNDSFYYIGMLNPENETDSKYIKKQFYRFKKCSESLKYSNDNCELYLHYKKIANDISVFLEGI